MPNLDIVLLSSYAGFVDGCSALNDLSANDAGTFKELVMNEIIKHNYRNNLVLITSGICSRLKESRYK